MPLRVNKTLVYQENSTSEKNLSILLEYILNTLNKGNKKYIQITNKKIMFENNLTTLQSVE